jgi:hypothetical protein
MRTPPGRWTNFSDPNLDPNRPQHHLTQIDPPRLEFPEKPRPQGILRHYRTPGYPLASLEQNPAYGTALTFMYANYARCQGASTLTLTLTGSQEC